MAQFQSEIELRVKVVDKELKRLEDRIQRLDKIPGATAFQAAGRVRQSQAILQVEKNRLDLQTRLTAENVKQLNLRSSWAKALRQGAEIQEQIAKNAEKEAAAVAKIEKSRRAQRSKQAGSALSNAAIGASFPLLFGQSGAAAVGGAVGGGLGSFLGPTGGFAGSLVGTVIGDLVDAQTEIKNLAREMGAGKEATDELVKAFQQAGQGADQLAAAIQGVRGIGLELDDEVEAIRLSSQLSEEFGGKIEKIVSSFNTVATSGKVAFGDLARFAGQGIPIFEQLEKNLGVSRSQLLGLAKDGKISAQQVVDALVQIGNAAEGNALKTEGRWQKAWRLIVEGAQLSLQAIGVVLGALVGDVNQTAGDIAVSFAELYRNLVVGAIEAAARISDAFAQILQGASNYADVFSLGGLNPIATKIRDEAGKAATDLNTLSENLRQVAAQGKNTEFKPFGNITLPGALDTDKTGGGATTAARSKLLQLEQQITQEKLKQQDLDTQYEKITQGRLAATQFELKGLADRYEQEVKIIELQRQNALANNKVAEDVVKINELYDERIKTERDRQGLKQIELNQLEAQLKLERELNSVKEDRVTEGVTRDLNRQIENVQERIESPFGGDAAEMAALQIEQTRRYEDAIRGLTEARDDALAAVKAQLQLDEAQRNNDIIRTELEKVAAIDKRRTAYENLIPQLNQVEQAELQLQQTLQKLQPITDGLASGITDVFTSIIDGSKSAQEAFADMLTNMGNALVQEGARMIAQYIAIGIARIFAGMGSSSNFDANPLGGLSFSQPSGFNPGNLFGRANGGPVTGGSPYIVGEQGQELFIPGKSGTIIPNDVFEATKECFNQFRPSSRRRNRRSAPSQQHCNQQHDLRRQQFCILCLCGQQQYTAKSTDDGCSRRRPRSRPTSPNHTKQDELHLRVNRHQRAAVRQHRAAPKRSSHSCQEGTRHGNC